MVKPISDIYNCKDIGTNTILYLKVGRSESRAKINVIKFQI